MRERERVLHNQKKNRKKNLLFFNNLILNFVSMSLETGDHFFLMAIFDERIFSRRSESNENKTRFRILMSFIKFSRELNTQN